MRIALIAVGTRMPAWIESGFDDYARRMPAECALELIEIPAGHRGKNPDLARILAKEGVQQLAAVPKGAQCLRLEVDGRAWSTEQLARQMDRWLQSGQDLALLVGGPEGLAPDLRRQCRAAWSLGPLTLPHPLVRVIVAEQLYRAWSLLHNHPYHRAG